MTDIRYFVTTSSGLDLLDLHVTDAGYTDAGSEQEYSIAGQAFAIVGNGAVNRVSAALGVTVDARALLADEDVVFFDGAWGDYTKDITSVSGAIVFTRTVNGVSESVTVSDGAITLTRDKLVFADGAVRTDTVRKTLADKGLGATVTDLTAEGQKTTDTADDWNASTTTSAPGALMPASPGGSVRGLAAVGTGVSFALPTVGVDHTLIGAAGTDRTYVPAGASVDARSLLGGEDIIYLTGAWADYTKDITSVSGAIVFTRTVGGMNESVTVSDGAITLTRDKLVFADGAVRTDTVRKTLADKGLGATVADLTAEGQKTTTTAADDWDNTTFTGVVAVGATIASVAISSTPVSGDTYQAGEVIQITVTFNEAVTVNIGGGTPTITITTDDGPAIASYASGSGSTALVFSYTVPGTAGHDDFDGIEIMADAITLVGGTIRDAASNDADLAHAAVAPQTGHRIDDGQPPPAPQLLMVATDNIVNAAEQTGGIAVALDGLVVPQAGSVTVQWLNTDGTTVLASRSLVFDTGLQSWPGNVTFVEADFAAGFPADGDGYAARVTQTDPFGRSSSDTSSSVRIDTVADTPVITSSLPGAIDPTASLTISGTAEPGSSAVSVTLSDSDVGTANSTKAATVTQNPDGTTTWSVTFDPASDTDYAALTAGSGQASVTATDLAGNSAEATAPIGIILSNTVLAAVTDLDVRSDLVLEASQAVSLVAAADAAGRTITLVHTADASRNIVLDLTNATDRAMIGFADGGTSGTLIRIDLAFDLDVGTNYRIEVSAGAFVGAGGEASITLDATSGIAFATVTPSAGSTAATSQIYGFTDSGSDGWDQAALAAGPGWFDMTGRGSGDGGMPASVLDFSSGDFVAYMGPITHGAGSFTVNGDFHGVIMDFGAGDGIYFDDRDNNTATYGSHDAADLEDILWGGTVAVGADTGNELAIAQTGVAAGQSYLDFTVTGHSATFVDGIASDGGANATNTLVELNNAVMPVLVA